VKLETFVNSSLFHFTKGLVLGNTIQWQITRLSTCSFWNSQAQEDGLQCQTVSKSMLWGWTLKVFKNSGNWGYLIKRPSGREGVKNQ
jgi:hypothetical protein